MKYDNIDLASLAERLIAARKAANITQDAAAKHLDMSRPTLIAIEKATRRPRPDELVKLATLYQEPLNKLLRNGSRPESLHPQLRTTLDSCLGLGPAAGPELEFAIATLAAYIDDYHYLETLLDAKAMPHFPPPVRIPPGPIERFAEHCAEEERARLNLGAHQPVYSLRKTLEEAGMHVFFEQLDSKLAGLYVFAPGFGYCILVNRQHPRERRRWTTAHEYGHFLCERDRPGVDYTKALQRKPESEKFADAFAAAFLMPDAGVQRRFYEEVERSGDFKVSDLCHMADYFAVSLMAMSLRLESLGLIPRGSWDQISAARVSVQSLKQEAGLAPARDDDAPEPYPQRYKLLAVQAFVDEKITEGQLAKFLRCQRIEARDIVQKCTETDDSNDHDGSMQLLLPLQFTRSLLVDVAG
jgi:Zn-dependent peptidase ImmA (M78 family)/transcriptional regulator with XRE-family HTH domain